MVPSCHSRLSTSRHHEIQLGAVKGGLPFFDDVRQLELFTGSYDRRRRLLPHFIRADVFLALRIPDADTGAEIAHVQRAEDKLNQVHDVLEFLVELFRRHE